MISVEIEGFIELVEMINKFLNKDLIRETIMDIVEDELYTYALTLYIDPDIPKEFSESLTTKIIEDLDVVVLVAWNEEIWRHRKYGSRLEWAIYECPRRHYLGGELSPEYTGPDWLKEKWTAYKSTFIDNVKSRILEYLRG